jgi:hypothetical protein
MEDFTPIQNEDNTPINHNIESDTLDSITDMFKEDKGGKTIDKELKEHRDLFSSNEDSRTGLDELGEEEVEDSGRNSLDSFGEEDDSSKVYDDEGNLVEEEYEEAVEEDELEDYFESAEFVIFIIEFIIMFGTNFYLKSQQLDSIAKEQLELTKRQQKTLIKAWAKVLRKHNTKISDEAQLLMTMGGIYGKKISDIVKEQKVRKQEEYEKWLKEQEKKPKKKSGKKSKMTVVQKDTPKEEKEEFEEVEEVEEIIEETAKEESNDSNNSSSTNPSKNARKKANRKRQIEIEKEAEISGFRLESKEGIKDVSSLIKPKNKK